MTRNGHAKPSEREVCRHFNTSRGCLRGDSCRYAHISPGGAANMAPSVNVFNTPCRYFAAGLCKYGDSCFYKHVSPPDGNGVPDDSFRVTSGPPPVAPSKTAIIEEYPCLICFEEKPSRYGLLPGCSHSFCMGCIRTWREVADKDISIVSSGAIKTCPVCRTPSSFIVPSAKFYPECDPMKKITIEKYKENLSRIPCKHIINRISLGRQPFCPFGRDCFFQHRGVDGEELTFDHGVEEMEAAQKRRLARRARAADFARFQEALGSIADDLLETNFETLMASIGDDDDDELAYNDTEDGYEDEEDDDWEAEEDADFQRILEQQWLSERFARLMIDADEGNRNGSNDWTPRFVPASHLPRRR